MVKGDWRGRVRAPVILKDRHLFIFLIGGAIMSNLLTCISEKQP